MPAPVANRNFLTPARVDRIRRIAYGVSHTAYNGQYRVSPERPRSQAIQRKPLNLTLTGATLEAT